MLGGKSEESAKNELVIKKNNNHLFICFIVYMNNTLPLRRYHECKIHKNKTNKLIIII